MALIVEDGVGKSTADSYISVTDSDTYVTKYHGASHAWISLTTAVKEVLLRRAALYMDDHYLPRWKGYASTDTQALQWPRYNVVTESGWCVDSDDIPDNLQRAQVEAGIRFNTDATAPQPDLDRGGKVKSEKVDVITVVYMDGASSRTMYTQVDELLNDLLHPYGKMVRG